MPGPARRPPGFPARKYSRGTPPTRQCGRTAWRGCPRGGLPPPRPPPRPRPRHCRPTPLPLPLPVLPLRPRRRNLRPRPGYGMECRRRRWRRRRFRHRQEWGSSLRAALRKGFALRFDGRNKRKKRTRIIAGQTVHFPVRASRSRVEGMDEGERKRRAAETHNSAPSSCLSWETICGASGMSIRAPLQMSSNRLFKNRFRGAPCQDLRDLTVCCCGSADRETKIRRISPPCARCSSLVASANIRFLEGVEKKRQFKKGGQPQVERSPPPHPAQEAQEAKKRTIHGQRNTRAMSMFEHCTHTTNHPKEITARHPSREHARHGRRRHSLRSLTMHRSISA